MVEIPVSKLVRLWAVEGFVKVKMDESFEMAAEKCLKVLIDRSLVSVRTWSFGRKIKSCRIHDMVYRLFLEKAQTTNFLNIISGRTMFSVEVHSPSSFSLHINVESNLVGRIIN